MEFDGLGGQDVNLQDAMRILMDGALTILARYTKKIDPDYPEGMIREEVGKIEDAIAHEEDYANLDFSDILRQAEQGFRNYPGRTGDIDSPWGLDFESRPKIKEVGEKSDDDDPNG